MGEELRRIGLLARAELRSELRDRRGVLARLLPLGILLVSIVAGGVVGATSEDPDDLRRLAVAAALDADDPLVAALDGVGVDAVVAEDPRAAVAAGDAEAALVPDGDGGGRPVVVGRDDDASSRTTVRRTGVALLEARAERTGEAEPVVAVPVDPSLTGVRRVLAAALPASLIGLAGFGFGPSISRFQAHRSAGRLPPLLASPVSRPGLVLALGLVEAVLCLVPMLPVHLAIVTAAALLVLADLGLLAALVSLALLAALVLATAAATGVGGAVVAARRPDTQAGLLLFVPFGLTLALSVLYLVRDGDVPGLLLAVPLVGLVDAVRLALSGTLALGGAAVALASTAAALVALLRVGAAAVDADGLAGRIR